MAVEQRHVRITSPCPVELDPNRGKDGAKSWYCGHCEKNVHVLSNMSEGEARSLLADKVGEDLCVSYAVRKDGTIRFKEPTPAVDPTVVPLASVRRRPSRPAAAAAVAAGLTAALAACTPHELPDKPQPQVMVEERHEAGGIGPVEIPTVDTPTPQHEVEEMIDGGLKGEPIPEPQPQPDVRDIPKPGGMRVAPLPDPEPEAVPVPGGLVVEPLPPADAEEPCDGAKAEPGQMTELHDGKTDDVELVGLL